MLRLSLCALLVTAAACGHASAFYRVDPETHRLTLPVRADASVPVRAPRYVRFEVSALPSARSFLDHGIVTIRIASGSLDVTRAFTAARALSPESKDRWFADLVAPVSDSGVLRVWVGVSVVKATPERMGQIADATQNLLSTLPAVAQVAATTRSAVDLAAALFDAKVEESFVQAFDLGVGPGCADSTTTCLATRDDETFVAAWGIGSAGDAAELRLDAGTLRRADGSPAHHPAVAVRVTTPSFPAELVKPHARATLQAPRARDGIAIEAGEIDDRLVHPLHRPALRAFVERVNAARATTTSEDGTALAVASLADWQAASCGPTLPAESLPCTAAGRVVASHFTDRSAARSLAAVLRRWESTLAEVGGLAEREMDPCDALALARTPYATAAVEADQLLERHRELGSKTPILTSLRRDATIKVRELAEACFAVRLGAESKKDPVVRSVLGSVTATDVRRGSFYIPKRAGMAGHELDRVRSAVASARSGVLAVAPARVEVPSIEWFVTFAETQCADAAAVTGLLQKRGDAIVAVVTSYLADALEAAKPYRGEKDLDALVEAAQELERAPADREAVSDLAEKLRTRRDALLAAVRNAEARKQPTAANLHEGKEP